MAISVLALATSPRRHGNSEDLLDYVLDAAVKSGADVEKIALPEIDVSPCRGCNACEREGVCIIHDDMKMLEEKITSADIIVLASPIFCMGLCSQAKAVIDRMQVFRSRRYVLGMPIVPPEKRGKKAGLFISTAGQDWDWVFDAAIPTVKCFYHLAGVRDRDIRYLMINKVDKKGEIRAHPTARASAEEAGSGIVSLVRSLREAN